LEQETQESVQPILLDSSMISAFMVELYLLPKFYLCLTAHYLTVLTKPIFHLLAPLIYIQRLLTQLPGLLFIYGVLAVEVEDGQTPIFLVQVEQELFFQESSIT